MRWGRLRVNGFEPSCFAGKYWIILGGLLVLLRLFLAATEGLVTVNDIWQKARIRESMSALADASVVPAKHPGVVLMLGASESLLGFQPVDFDRAAAAAGKQTLSFNFSYQNVGTMLPLFFSRVRRTLLDRSMRVRVVFISLPMSRLTIRSTKSIYSQYRYHDLDAVFFDPSIWSALRISFSDTLALCFNKYVLGERSLLQLARAVRQAVRRIYMGPAKDDDDVNIFYGSRLHPMPGWDVKRRGGYYLNIESEPALVQKLIATAQSPKGVEASGEDMVRCCDVINMRIDNQYVKDVIHAIRSLHIVAKHVVLVDFPETPALKRSEEVRARVRTTLKRIARESGSDLWIAQDHASFESSDFFDLSHLTPTGVAKLNSTLAGLLPTAWLKEAQ